MQRLQALSAHFGHGAAQEAIQGGLLGASARQRLEAMPGALRQGYATSNLAARVAAVAAAHELAKLAGRVPGGAPALPDDRAAAGKAAACLPLPVSMSCIYASLRRAQSAKVILVPSISVQPPARKPWDHMCSNASTASCPSILRSADVERCLGPVGEAGSAE